MAKLHNHFTTGSLKPTALRASSANLYGKACGAPVATPRSTAMVTAMAMPQRRSSIGHGTNGEQNRMMDRVWQPSKGQPRILFH